MVLSSTKTGLQAVHDRHRCWQVSHDGTARLRFDVKYAMAVVTWLPNNYGFRTIFIPNMASERSFGAHRLRAQRLHDRVVAVHPQASLEVRDRLPVPLDGVG